MYGAIASRVNDDGVTALFHGILGAIRGKGFGELLGDWGEALLPDVETRAPSRSAAVIPGARVRYLAEIAETVRAYHERVGRQTTVARERQRLIDALRMLEDAGDDSGAKTGSRLRSLIRRREDALDDECRALLEEWPAVRAAYSGKEHRQVHLQGREPHFAELYDPVRQ